MKKLLVDYKGKHRIIVDEDTVDEMDIVDVMASLENVLNNLEFHVKLSQYHGVPAYIGQDKDLHKKIDEIIKKLK